MINKRERSVETALAAPIFDDKTLEKLWEVRMVGALRVHRAVTRATRILSRVWPGLVPAAVGAAAGATVVLAPETASAAKCFSIGDAFCFPESSPTLPRTGGAVAQAWALGTLTETAEPKSGAACDLSDVCDLVIKSDGTEPGTGFTIQREFSTGDFVFPGNLPFVLEELVDYKHPVTNGVGGSCYPAIGTVTITVGTSGNLVLDFQGQACQLGEHVALLFNGAYTGDSASTDTFANAEAIGNFTMEGPSGLNGHFTTAKVSLNGQLLLEGEPPPK